MNVSRNKLITRRLSVHKALMDGYVCNGMTRDEASKSAFAVVQAMTPAKLNRYYEEGR